MTINNVSNIRVGAANNKAAAPKAAAANNAGRAPKIAGDRASFKAQAGEDDQAKLDAFIAANKAQYPELEQAKLTLGDHLKADAVLFVLAGAVGAGSHELIRALTNKDQALIAAKAMSTDPVERKLVARDYKISVGTAMQLAADPDLSVRYALAARMKSQPHQFDSAVLEIMANDPNPMIRGMVATSDKLSKKTVSRLANGDTEPSPQVRASALQNKNLDKNERAFLEKLDGEKGGIYATMMRIMTAADNEGNNKLKIGFLRSNPNIGLSREMMEGMAKSEDAGVREALARRPDLADDLVKQMYEHRSYTLWQKIMRLFGNKNQLPAGKPQYEQNRIVLMSLANNPNASAGMLTEMVEKAKKNGSDNNFKSRIDAKIDSRLGIPTTDLDPDQYNTDIVARAIVGNPKTDDTMRQLANAAAYPYRYSEKTSLQAFLAINKANDLYLNGKYDEAAQAYKNAIATTFHDSEQAYFELGQCLMASGDVTNARFAFMQALNINNNYGAAAEALDAINRPTGRG
jgi:tetratricopeptide (TPR) repeat protein